MYDALGRRIEDLQDNLKGIRSSLVLEVRAARVSGFGEETQEFRLLSRRGGGGGGGSGCGSELRLRAPCGNSLEDCTCGRLSSPPAPVGVGSLSSAIDAAREAVAVAAAAATAAAGDGTERGSLRERGGYYAGGNSSSARTGIAARKSKKRRRVLEDDGEEDNEQQHQHGGQREAPARAGATVPRESPNREPRGQERRVDIRDAGFVSENKNRSSTIAGTGSGTFYGTSSSGGDCGDNSGANFSGSLDEIKRQMGKNPLELERSKNALEEEMRAAEGRGRGGNHDQEGLSGGEDSSTSAGGGFFAAVPEGSSDEAARKVGREEGGEVDGRGSGRRDGGGNWSAVSACRNPYVALVLLEIHAFPFTRWL